jgi:hypothetical protein
MPQLDFLVLAVAQETNRLKINEIDLSQIYNRAGSLALHPLAEFFDAIGTEPAD